MPWYGWLVVALVSLLVLLSSVIACVVAFCAWRSGLMGGE
jgi:hypothetical protein